MERQLKTKGIVLRRIDFGEADQILTILTQDQGKISLVAKAARRLKSRFLGKLELMNEVQLVYFQGRELGHLNEVESFALFDEKNMDLKSRSFLFYMAEATHKLVAEGQDCQRTYQHLKEALNHFENYSESIFYGYLIKLLTELGFMQDWSKCSETNSKLDLSKAYFVSDQDGSLTSNPQLSLGIALSPSVIKWVNYMQKENFDQLKNIKPSLAERKEVFVALKCILGTILNYPFKSEAFMQLIES